MSDWNLFKQIAGVYHRTEVVSLYKQVGGADVLRPLTTKQRDAIAARATAYSEFSDKVPVSKEYFIKYLDGEYYDAIDVADSLAEDFFARGRTEKDDVHIAMNQLAMDVMPLY